MAIVTISHLKHGDRINEDVQTQLGGTLFNKGKVIYQKEIDILKAFLIHSVSIDSRNNASENVIQEDVVVKDETKNVQPFYEKYNNMLANLKTVFRLADSGASLPILEMRTTLEQLIAYIDQYNVLTFVPRNMQINDYLYHNSIMVSLTSYSLAKWMGLAQKDLIPIAMCGLLHDIGNVRIDSTILNKPSKLTGQELEEMKKHTIIGYNILKNVTGINEGIKLCTLQHHEREDGSGYPLSVKGDKIHLYAKIIAVSDIYHAMTSNRFHKKAESRYLVLEQLQAESFGKLDPTIVQTFIQKVTQLHHGTVVRLNNGSVGSIVFTDRVNVTRPMVNINGKIINLALTRELFIQDVIQT